MVPGCKSGIIVEPAPRTQELLVVQRAGKPGGPTGEEMVVHAVGAGKVWQRSLGEGRHPLWSPGGDRLAFSRSVGGTALDQVFVAQLAHWAPRRLLETRSACYPYSWSSDGGNVYVGADSRVAAVEAETGEVTYIGPTDGIFGSPMVSPDGRHIAFGRVYPEYPGTRGGIQVWVMGADGSSTRPVSQRKGEFAPIGWTFDSKRLLFYGLGTVWAYSVQTGATHRVSPPSVAAFDPSVAQGGRYLTYAAVKDGRLVAQAAGPPAALQSVGEIEIDLLDLAKDTPKAIASEVRPVTWVMSPVSKADGSLVAWIAWQAKGRTVLKVYDVARRAEVDRIAAPADTTFMKLYWRPVVVQGKARA